MAHGQKPGMLHLQFFSKQKAALHGRLCSGRGARRRGRWWAKKSLGSKWLPSLHWASGAVQVLARGGFCLPFMGVPVVVPAFGLRLDGHGGLLLDGHGGVRPCLGGHPQTRPTGSPGGSPLGLEYVLADHVAGTGLLASWT